MSNWLVTLFSPATSVASASTDCFSSSDRTGPFSVTWPFCVMILTLWAYLVPAHVPVLQHQTANRCIAQCQQHFYRQLSSSFPPERDTERYERCCAPDHTG